MIATIVYLLSYSDNTCTVLAAVEEYFECSHLLVNEYWREALESKCTMWGFRVPNTNNSVSLRR
jgi:hypothetical protein